jgi:glycosyltransferase involved in cell wall biosynthesis
MVELPSGASPALSVVIPAYNEAANVEPCYRELVEVLAAEGRPFEIVFVDDGSTDGTTEALRRLARADPRVRVLRLRHNAGQTAALDAGFRAARGAVVVTMDADLQNDPRDIPKLLAALPGHDAVCGWRVARHDPWSKRAASRLANRVRDRFTRDGVHDTGCTLKAFRREALERLRLYRGMHRFLPALLQMEGFRVTELPVSHRARLAGTSKYGNWGRLWAGLADLWAVRWMARRRVEEEGR